MGKVKKILENELIGGVQGTDIYPITSVVAVYDKSNVRLDTILGYSCKTLNRGNYITVVENKLTIRSNKGISFASCSNFLKLYTGTNLTLYDIANSSTSGYSNVPAILFFDSNFSYISSIKSTETTLEVPASGIPSNAMYFIIQSNGAKIPYVIPASMDVSIIDTGISIFTTMQLSDIDMQLSDIDTDVNNLKETALLLKHIPVTRGNYINKNTGSPAPHGSGAITDYIKLSGASEITYSGKYGQLSCMVAYYDSDKKFISSVGDSSNLVVVTDYKITSFPDNAVYFRASFLGYVETHSVITDTMEGKQYVDIDALEENISNTNKEIGKLREQISDIQVGIDSEYSASNLEVPNSKESMPFGSLFSKAITINTLKYIARETKTDNKIIIGTFDEEAKSVIVNSIIPISDAVIGENTIPDLNIKILPKQVLYILGNDRYVTASNNKFGDELVSALGTSSIANTQIGGSARINQNLKVAKAIQVIGTINEPITEEYINKIVAEKVVTASTNYLYGKILSVTGDSEAAGHSIGKQNTYGALIAGRNKMTINNYAVNGRKLASQGGSGTPVVDAITEIAENSDYILCQIGYNDTFDSSENDDSKDITRYKGAFNTVIEGWQQHYPKAKIGIIIPYYFNRQQTRIDRAEWMKKRCEYYHIQYIDGTLLSGLRRKSECPEQEDYFIDDVHLTALGHERMSYIYENFLRGL